MGDFVRRLLFLPEQASSIASQIDGLHFFVISVTMLGAIMVGVTTLVFVWRYRRRHDHVYTSRIVPPMSLEVGWIAGLLLLFLMWWFIGYRQYLHATTPPQGAVEAYVTAKQWMWKFAYPDGRSSIGILTVPVGKPVRLNMISRDVIHSFYVPAFRIKHDVLPGRYTTTWFQAEKPGSYQILSTEYCGLGHSSMWGTVVALSPADYRLWLEKETPPGVLPSETQVLLASESTRMATQAAQSVTDVQLAIERSQTMAQKGQQTAVRHGCLACHTIDGRRHIGPSWRGLFGRTVELEDGRTVHADEAYLTESMMDPRAGIVKGFAPVMPSYWGVLDEVEVATLVEFIKDLKGERLAEDFPGRPAGSLQTPGGEGAQR